MDHQTEIVDPLFSLDLMDDEDFYPELQSTVSYNEVDYFILIQGIIINNDYSYGLSLTLMPPSGKLMPGINSSEQCIVEYEVQLIEVNSWEIVNNFYVSGIETVNFYNYESALLDAISNSISNTITYLKTGDTYYFK